MLSSLILFGFASLINAAAQNSVCLPTGGVRNTFTVNFDDLNATTALHPAPTLYEGFKFDPSWNIVQAGPNIPFIPHSPSNVLVTGPNYNNTHAEFSVAEKGDAFDVVSLWMIGCFVNPRYFSNDTACLTTFTGKRIDGSVVSFERPVRKTTMEIIQDFPDRKFTNLVSFHMKNRWEIKNQTSGHPAGRFGIDNIVINKVDPTASCAAKKYARYVKY
ncbi:uncharacterized protein LAJ45_08879 [Morchella importuna]|uniref:Concanavalin A-like lectin/glucanase n=1 Tax=Morchella conica CCBAS932 TaxID=1392247 RepID=A0A3N4KHD6_9PEZI|nr:uncharacterized protein LAJ45_08879 [Morchella importuna]KAH8147080.1 hypothetical protein LAJ45_08879 [Morchella importuna]RPB09900.1 hypothetical protein P167DRAFT_547661 [Morchella conica CCBAS932]